MTRFPNWARWVKKIASFEPSLTFGIAGGSLRSLITSSDVLKTEDASPMAEDSVDSPLSFATTNAPTASSAICVTRLPNRAKLARNRASGVPSPTSGMAGGSVKSLITSMAPFQTDSASPIDDARVLRPLSLATVKAPTASRAILVTRRANVARLERKRASGAPSDTSGMVGGSSRSFTTSMAVWKPEDAALTASASRRPASTASCCSPTAAVSKASAMRRASTDSCEAR